MTAVAGERQGPLWKLARRWPTAVALAAAVLVWGGGLGDAADAVSGLGPVVLLLALEYLILNQIGRREASWPVIGGMVAAVFVIELLDVVDLTTVAVAAALVLLVWGTVTGTANGRGSFGIQAAGMLGFGAIALVAMAVDPDLGRYLVAAGWLLHGIWDAVHLKLDRVVSRSYAEACGVLDVAVAAMLLFLL
ncbi:hypothetical protein [Actinomadura livida]|uniref:Uncharacterized protein n=1 Tax=Actinomadura livida TaxID=79909 RepID=A0A7W7I925_9ACTN|nr:MULTISPECIES: hypothetical protein [Actinomadura]MBB4772666.1 hypothetical protein [Actinomadura catellatispora]GGU11985.1 hypothetical protein GCM10010208_40800 [Actinomadura livida]